MFIEHKQMETLRPRNKRQQKCIDICNRGGEVGRSCGPIIWEDFHPLSDGQLSAQIGGAPATNTNHPQEHTYIPRLSFHNCYFFFLQTVIWEILLEAQWKAIDTATR